MTRKTQDFLTWLLAVGIVVSQLTPWIPHRPDLIVLAGGIFGFPLVRKVQDAINNEDEEVKE